MSDLIEKIRAAIDEDERAAKAWLPIGNPDEATRGHVARHDPARVLRHVAAHRKILEQHEHTSWEAGPINSAGRGCGVCAWDGRLGETLNEGWCVTVLALAEAYGIEVES